MTSTEFYTDLDAIQAEVRAIRDEERAYLALLRTRAVPIVQGGVAIEIDPATGDPRPVQE